MIQICTKTPYDFQCRTIRCVERILYACSTPLCAVLWDAKINHRFPGNIADEANRGHRIVLFLYIFFSFPFIFYFYFLLSLFWSLRVAPRAPHTSKHITTHLPLVHHIIMYTYYLFVYLFIYTLLYVQHAAYTRITLLLLFIFTARTYYIIIIIFIIYYNTRVRLIPRIGVRTLWIFWTSPCRRLHHCRNV